MGTRIRQVSITSIALISVGALGLAGAPAQAEPANPTGKAAGSPQASGHPDLRKAKKTVALGEKCKPNQRNKTVSTSRYGTLKCKKVGKNLRWVQARGTRPPLPGETDEVRPAFSADAFEAEVFQLTNAARSQGRTCGEYGWMPAVQPVGNEHVLAAVARAHSQDMATRNYFSHVTPEGLWPVDRANAAGYPSYNGENIAFGYTSPTAVVDGWLKSDGHCRNIMEPESLWLGVGAATNSQGTLYWTQNFGSRAPCGWGGYPAC